LSFVGSRRKIRVLATKEVSMRTRGFVLALVAVALLVLPTASSGAPKRAAADSITGTATPTANGP